MRTLLEQINDLKAELVSKQTAIDELTKLVQEAKATPTIPVADTDEYKALVEANKTMTGTVEQLTAKLTEAESKITEFNKAVEEAAAKKALEISAQQGLPTPVTDYVDQTKQTKPVNKATYTVVVDRKQS